MANASLFELALLTLINEERETVGLDPLRLNTLLNDAAEAHSRWMLEVDQFSHAGEDGSTPGERMEIAGYPFEGQSLSAENIGWQSLRGEDGFEDDVAQVHESLMNSPGHRANILNPDAEDVGLGVEIGTFSGETGDYEAVMVTQVFAATEADVSAWLDPGTGMPDEDPLPEETPDATDPLLVADENPDDSAEDVDPPVAEEFPDEDLDVADPLIAENVPDDTLEETDPPVVVEETPDSETTPDQIVAECPEADSIATDDTPSEEETPPTTSPEAALPFTFAEVSIDLSEAFEFRQEGDQIIVETSEDRLFDAFLSSFDAWMAEMDQPADLLNEDPPENVLADLMLGDQSDQVIMSEETDPVEEWLLADCA